jgi:hypothetical protein
VESPAGRVPYLQLLAPETGSCSRRIAGSAIERPKETLTWHRVGVRGAGEPARLGYLPASDVVHLGFQSLDPVLSQDLLGFFRPIYSQDDDGVIAEPPQMRVEVVDVYTHRL